jgi:hypothetical protein
VDTPHISELYLGVGKEAVVTAVGWDAVVAWATVRRVASPADRVSAGVITARAYSILYLCNHFAAHNAERVSDQDLPRPERTPVSPLLPRPPAATALPRTEATGAGGRPRVTFETVLNR